jgi:hypothetical protein
MEKWILFFLEKGFLSGFNLFRKYLDTIVTRQKYHRLEIIYCQCNFLEEGSFNLIKNKSEAENFPVILSQLGEIDIDINRYSGKGEFLRVDTLILIRHCHSKKYYLLVVDLSIFSVKSLKDIKDLDNIENWKQILLSEIIYLRSKSLFSGLNIDTGEKGDSLGVNFAKDLTNYYQAFKRQDKETVKLIQAGSYGYSFYQFLLNKKILTVKDEIKINVMGYSDRSVNSIAVTPENLDLLKTCQYIYQQETKQDILKGKRKVIKTIKYNARKSFTKSSIFYIKRYFMI